MGVEGGGGGGWWRWVTWGVDVCGLGSKILRIPTRNSRSQIEVWGDLPPLRGLGTSASSSSDPLDLQVSQAPGSPRVPQNPEFPGSTNHPGIPRASEQATPATRSFRDHLRILRTRDPQVPSRRSHFGPPVLNRIPLIWNARADHGRGHL